ncbi:hypothetical protein KAJ27_02435 [bacterium]|nr:hypothetical protein [bacterium]
MYIKNFKKEGTCIFILFFLLITGFNSNSLLAKSKKSLDSKEYKILLKARKFKNSNAGTSTFLQLVINLAAEHGIPFSAGPGRKSSYSREVVYLDTKDFDLYENNYILRKRYRLSDKKHDIVLKYRAKSFQEAENANVEVTSSFKGNKKFEEDISSKSGNNFNSVFSLSNKVKSDIKDIPKTINGLSTVFPILSKLKIPGIAKLSTVNNRKIIEKKYSPGFLYFSNKVKGETALSIWYLNEKVLIAEFSFTVKLKSKGPNKVIKNFFTELNRRSIHWKEKGTTKTSLIYK